MQHALFTFISAIFFFLLLTGQNRWHCRPLHLIIWDDIFIVYDVLLKPLFALFQVRSQDPIQQYGVSCRWVYAW